MAAYSNKLFEELGITGKIIELGKRFDEIDKMAEEDVNVLLTVVDIMVAESDYEESEYGEDSGDEYEYEMNTDGIYDTDEYHHAEEEFRRLEFVQDKYAEFAKIFGYESD
jgi:hypothetical protein